VFGKVDVDFKKYDDTESILHFLKDMSPNKRKTILSALVIITDKKEYRTLMMEDVRDYNKEISKAQSNKNNKKVNKLNYKRTNIINNYFNLAIKWIEKEYSGKKQIIIG
jgi:hypothetical protein